MPRRNRDVENTLLTKFEFTASKHSDKHRWVKLQLPGLPVIATFFSHAKGDIGDVLWKKIARQLRVRTSYLNGMMDCHNSRDDYYKKVREEPFAPGSNR
jgi:hypothetical protein